MAFAIGSATVVIDGNDISQYVDNVDFDISSDIKTFQPVGGFAATKQPGNYSGTASLKGANDPALEAILAPLALASPKVLKTFVYRPNGTGGSTRAISCSVYVASFRVSSPGDNFATWTSDLAVSGTITDA
jgi:hypothetical protein